MHRRNPPHRASATCEIDAAPTLERMARGPVERLERAFADGSGRPARPFRAVDTLALMERRGSITAAMRQAAEDFRTRFAVAQLDPLRALDYSRPRDGAAAPRNADTAPGARVEGARQAVWRAILAVGGIGSPGGSCLWHVVGWERSLKEWALEQGWSGRRVSQEAASGILVATLGALEAHFQRGASLRKSNLDVDKSGSIGYTSAKLAKPGRAATGDDSDAERAVGLSRPVSSDS
jgi:hypothetical protein